MKLVNNLFIGAIAFVVLISIALITIRQPEHPYELSQEATLEKVLNNNKAEVIPEELRFLNENQKVKLSFIDLRSPGEFVKGHIDGAVNIPQNSILQEDNLEFFRSLDSTHLVVIYGHDQVQASGPWMILKQLGIDNIKMLKGGYSYYSTSSLNISELPDTPEYMIEVPQCDYNEVMAQTPGMGDVTTETEGPKEIVPVRREKKKAVAGGC